MSQDLKKYPIKEVFEKFYDSDPNLMARAVDVSVQQIRNWISQSRKLIQLADGRFLLDTDRVTIYKPDLSHPDNELGPSDFFLNLYGGSRTHAALSAGISLFQLNNYIAKYKDKSLFIKTEQGFYFAMHTKCKIFKTKISTISSQPGNDSANSDETLVLDIL